MDGRVAGRVVSECDARPAGCIARGPLAFLVARGALLRCVLLRGMLLRGAMPVTAAFISVLMSLPWHNAGLRAIGMAKTVDKWISAEDG